MLLFVSLRTGRERMRLDQQHQHTSNQDNLHKCMNVLIFALQKVLLPGRHLIPVHLVNHTPTSKNFMEWCQVFCEIVYFFHSYFIKLFKILLSIRPRKDIFVKIAQKYFSISADFEKMRNAPVILSFA